MKKTTDKAAVHDGMRRHFLTRPNCYRSYVPMGYVENLNDARTELADFLSSLLGWEERAPAEDS